MIFMLFIALALLVNKDDYKVVVRKGAMAECEV